MLFRSKSTPHRRSHILDLIQANVCITDARTLENDLYFVTFIDDHSRKVWTFVLKSKDHVLDIFKHFHAGVGGEIERH